MWGVVNLGPPDRIPGIHGNKNFMVHIRRRPRWELAVSLQRNFCGFCLWWSFTVFSRSKGTIFDRCTERLMIHINARYYMPISRGDWTTSFYQCIIVFTVLSERQYYCVCLNKASVQSTAHQTIQNCQIFPADFQSY
jgi:hypothetical protein